MGGFSLPKNGGKGILEIMGLAGVFYTPKWCQIGTWLATWPELIFAKRARRGAQRSFRFRWERIGVFSVSYVWDAQASKNCLEHSNLNTLSQPKKRKEFIPEQGLRIRSPLAPPPGRLTPQSRPELKYPPCPIPLCFSPDLLLAPHVVQCRSPQHPTPPRAPPGSATPTSPALAGSQSGTRFTRGRPGAQARSPTRAICSGGTSTGCGCQLWASRPR